MSRPHPHKETEEEFHDRCAKEQKEAEYLDWCKEEGEDPSVSEVRERYDEIQAETGDEFWEGQSPADREGYESMMTQD